MAETNDDHSNRIKTHYNNVIVRDDYVCHIIIVFFFVSHNSYQMCIQV